MEFALENLVRAYGPPLLVLPPPPRSERAASAEPYLLVTQFVEVLWRHREAAKAKLAAEGLRVVEGHSYRKKYLHLYLEPDIMPTSRDALQAAIERRQVIAVSQWSSMGDTYVEFHILTPAALDQYLGVYCLYFPHAPGLRDEELPSYEEEMQYQSAQDFWDFFKRHFIRKFQL